MLSKSQEFAIQTIKKLRYVSLTQLWWIISHAFPAVTANRFEQDMRQLRYLGELMITDEVIRHSGLIERQSASATAISVKNRIRAIEIMILLSEKNVPIFGGGRQPCELLFFVVNGDSMNAYKVYNVANGKEMATVAQIQTDSQPHDCIALLAVEDADQVPLLSMSLPMISDKRPHYYVLWEKGRYIFLHNNN